jgi:hypothetical protein
MKNIILLLSLFTFFSTAQAQTIAVLGDGSQLKNYPATKVNGGMVQLRNFFGSKDKAGGLFFWDSSSVEKEVPGMIIPRDNNAGRWIRVINDYKLYAQWFGVKADGVTDDTKALQAAIDYSLAHKAMHVILPQGAIVVTQTIEIGTMSRGNNPDAEQTSFEISGQGMSVTTTAFSGGTSIIYKGTPGDTTAIINIRTSAGRYVTFEKFNIQAEMLNGAGIAVNFVTSTHSYFEFKDMKFGNTATGVKQNKGDGGNGEFTLYDHCRFEQFTENGYYHDAPQALSIKFFCCAFSPREGATVWNFVNASGGQFIGNDISFANLGTGKKCTVFKIGGPQSDPIMVQGGRWEGTDQLVYFYPSTNRLTISFESVMIGVNLRNIQLDAIDFSDASHAGLAKVLLHNCSIYISTGKPILQSWNVKSGNIKNAFFKAIDCQFLNTITTTNTDQIKAVDSNSKIELIDCTNSVNKNGVLQQTYELDKFRPVENNVQNQ